MKKRVIALILATVMCVCLTACGEENANRPDAAKVEVTSGADNGTKTEAELKTEVDAKAETDAKTGTEAEADAEPELQPREESQTEGETDAENAAHYYGTMVVTSTYQNVGDFIYGIYPALFDFGLGDGAYMGYEPNLTIHYDTSTGKTTDGVLKFYVPAYNGWDGELNYPELYEEAILSSANLANKISDFSQRVEETNSDGYPMVTCMSANVDVSEYWADFEQHLCLYCIERKQDIDGLVKDFMDYKNNGVTVDHGSNYITDPINGLKYEWFD